MGKCININDNSFKQLVEQTGLPAHALAIEISLYQDKNNTDEFPSVEFLQVNTTLPYADAVEEFKVKYKLNKTNNLYPTFDIPKKLVDSARDNPKYDEIQFGVKSSPAGYSVAFNEKYNRPKPQGKQTSLFQQYEENQKQGDSLPALETALRNYHEAIGIKLNAVEEIYYKGEKVNANAVANTLLKTIDYIEGRLRRDTMAEETSHIWFRQAGGKDNPMLRKMMNEVTKFKIYEEVVRLYGKDYNYDEELLQEEAVGKVIASYMLNQFTGEPTLDELGKSWFEKLWMKIKSFFVGNKFKGASLDILKAKVSEYNTPSDTSGEFLQVNEESKEEPIEEEENIHKAQYVFFKRRLAFLEAELKQMGFNDARYERYKAEIKELESMFETAQKENDYKELGERVLKNTENFIKRLEAKEVNITSEKLDDTLGVIEAFKEYPELETRARELERKLFPFIFELGKNEINYYATEGIEITEKMINDQLNDTLQVVTETAALANSSNYIVRTVASVTKAAQNRYTAANKTLTHDIQTATDKLIAYGKQTGLSLEQVYELLMEEKTFDNEGESKTIVGLAGKKKDGKINPKWTKIKSTPELLEYYLWYQKQVGVADKKLGTTSSPLNIPNVKKKKGIIEKWKAEDLETDEFQTGLQEELFADIVSNKAYRTPLSPEEKSRDLGDAILRYRAFANKYEELSQALPKARILQKMLEIKKTKSGIIVEREFIRANNKKTTIKGRNSQRWKMVDRYIDMQIKGKMKGDNQTKFSKGADQLMAFTSLLRIGASPVSATSNLIFGKLSNMIEGIGGRFFTNKELTQAEVIFMQETFNKDSKTNLMLEMFPMLQELTDYENISKVRIQKKYSPEQIKEMMYLPQKAGEKLLQTTTMIASMKHDKIKSIDGKSEISIWDAFEVVKNEKGEASLKVKEGYEFSQKQVERYTDKIQRLNEMIHGRYSSRDAAIMSQHVLYRMVLQFKKWVPTQIENRIMQKQYDNRLGVYTEGRYLTFRDVVLKKAFKEKQVGKAFYNMLMPLINAKAALEKGGLTELEIYNMRKMMVEIIIALSLVLLFASLAGGDDDEKMKNPWVKFGLTLLNRASSDLTFFYSATEINNLGKNAMPISRTVSDIIDVVFIVPKVLWTGEYIVEKGSNKGRYKIEKEVVDVVPILNPIFGQMRRIMSDNKLEELN